MAARSVAFITISIFCILFGLLYASDQFRETTTRHALISRDQAVSVVFSYTSDRVKELSNLGIDNYTINNRFVTIRSADSVKGIWNFPLVYSNPNGLEYSFINSTNDSVIGSCGPEPSVACGIPFVLQNATKGKLVYFVDAFPYSNYTIVAPEKLDHCNLPLSNTLIDARTGEVLFSDLTQAQQDQRFRDCFIS